MVRSLAALFLLIAVLAASPVYARPADCRDMTSIAAEAGGRRRPATNEEIIQLRDIGSQEPQVVDKPSPIAISPEGRRAAFVLSRADIASNAGCRVLVVLSLTGTGSARVVDRGGEPITFRHPIRGLWVDVGVPIAVSPVWSKDGRELFYLKRVDGRTALWRVDVARGTARAATHVDYDIETVVRPTGSSDLLVTGRPGWVAARQAIATESQRGWLYDERIVPGASAEPRVKESLTPEQLFRFDPRSGKLFDADSSQRAPYRAAMTIAAADEAVNANGARAAISYLSWGNASARIALTEQGGNQKSCVDPSCTGWLLGLWWTRDARSIIFLKREGADNELSSLYRWTPETGVVTRLLSTPDAIQNCAMAAVELVCTRESSVRPRYVIAIDPAGGVRELFDPNPGFRSVVLGRVERLHWTNDLGLPAWGDLVLPPNIAPGTKLPLIVVQYFSRGFLRGGTNNEYPIYPLAARGFAVLSLQRPPAKPSTLPPGASSADHMNEQFADWQDFRSALSSMEYGIAAAARTDAIDMSRLGITGLSDGAAVARFALINSHLFKAAAISGCCMDPTSYLAYGGTAWSDELQAAGFPRLVDGDRDFWKPVSLAENAARLDTPLLIQASDEEYLLALDGFERLREYHQPIEMFVFPSEHHGKSQPVHKLAVAERTEDWFDFWLNCKESPDPTKREQYARWRRLREAAPATY